MITVVYSAATLAKQSSEKKKPCTKHRVVYVKDISVVIPSNPRATSEHSHSAPGVGECKSTRMC